MSKPKCRTLGEFYTMMSRELTQMQETARTETDAKRRAKFEKNIRIRTAFLAKLKRTIDNEHSSEAASAPRSPKHRPRRSRVSPAKSSRESWDWITITDFPGEFDIDPWD